MIIQQFRKLLRKTRGASEHTLGDGDGGGKAIAFGAFSMVIGAQEIKHSLTVR